MELGSKMGWKASHSFQGAHPQHIKPAGLGLEAQQQCTRKLSSSLSLPVYSHIYSILLWWHFKIRPNPRQEGDTLCMGMGTNARSRAESSLFKLHSRGVLTTPPVWTSPGEVAWKDATMMPLLKFLRIYSFHPVKLDPPAPTAQISWVIS